MGVITKKKPIPEVRLEKMRLDKIKSDPDAEALSRSDQMRPYIEFMAAIYSKDEKASQIAAEKIKALPLEKRYIWRIVQALDWGFADFDSETVRIDMGLLSDADRKEMDTKLEEVQRTRVVQLCLFLQKLYGSENMKKLMEGAVEEALAYGMSAEDNEELN